MRLAPLALPLAALLALAACSKTSEKNVAQPTPPLPGPAVAGPAAPAPSATADEYVSALLADDTKVKAYFSYLKDFAPQLRLMMQMGGKNPHTPEATAIQSDAQSRAFFDADRAAQAKNHLTQAEVSALADAISDYSMSLWVVRDSQRRGGTGAEQKTYAEQYENAKAAVLARFGPRALDAVSRHEKEMLQAQSALMAAMAGR